MDRLRRRSWHALIIGTLSLGLALGACAPGTIIPTSRAEHPAAVVASAIPPTAVSPSAPVAVPTMPMVRTTAAVASVIPQLTALPSTATWPAAPTPVPALTPTVAVPTEFPTAPPLTHVREADRLASDQPWVLVSDAPHLCGASLGDLGYSLIAIDRAGGLTRLNRGVMAIAKRLGAPPLLVTCEADGAFAIVDPLHWTSAPLSIPPGITVAQIVLSPDQQQVILRLGCIQPYQCPMNSPVQLQIVDLQTGTMHSVPDFSMLLSVGGGPYSSESVDTELLGWGRKGLYYTVSINEKIPTFTLNLLDLAGPQAISQTLAQNTHYMLDSSHDRMLVISDTLTSENISFTLSDVRQHTTQILEQGRWLSSPVFAPDGAALAYFRSDDLYSGQLPHMELVVFDITRNTTTVLTDMFATPSNLVSGGALNTGLAWSQDGQRIYAGTRSPQGVSQASLLTRDGILLNTVTVTDGAALEITSDDQLILNGQDGHVVSWLPLRAGAAPYAPSVMMDGYVSSMFLPPLGSSAPPPAARTNAAVPMPLPSARAPIAKLGDESSDMRLQSSVPVYDSVLYTVRGSLYSQALRGGPVVSVGEGQPIIGSPDRKTFIAQRPDGLYRVPFGGGPPTRITPPLSDGTTGIVGTQVSPDGRQLVYGVTGPQPASWNNQLRKEDPWIVALYCVPVAGGTPVRLTPPLDPDSTIANMIISADSRNVIYTVNMPIPDVAMPSANISTRIVAIYSVSIAGGTVRRFAESMRVDDPLGNIHLSNDGQYLLYQHPGRIGNSIWSTPVVGGQAVALDTSGGMGNAYQISADNRSVLYHNGEGIYVAPIGGGALVNVTSSVRLPDGGYGVQFTPDSKDVLFRSGRTLYRAPISGGPAIRLFNYTSDIDTTHTDIFAADRSVIYQDGNAIFSIPLAGGTPMLLTPPVDHHATLIMDQLSPDARYIIYTIEDQAQRTRAIYSLSVSGGSPALLFADLAISTRRYAFSEGYAIGLANGLLYAAPLAGGMVFQLSTIPATSDSPVISADGRHIIYVAHHPVGTAGNARALYVATLPAARP
jgi:Tol biopolymer transport system component